MIFKKLSGSLLISSLVLTCVGTSFASSTDPTQLPIGDGKISTSPKVGYVYACPTGGGGGGAQKDGPWIHGSTWNLKEKLHVQGSISWPNAQFTIGSPESGRKVVGNGLPVDSVSGTFPIATTDPAHQYDGNPNTITTQSYSFTLPTSPTAQASPSCVPMGPVGIALNGVAIFNALDGENRDAVAHEVQDSCGGHPEKTGMYHYHGPSTCIPHQNDNNALIGYAIDGFGIYSGHDAQGKEIATKDLDECHGTTSEVTWNGQKVSMYHYVLTQDYPYTIGCLRAPIVTLSSSFGSGTTKTDGQRPTSLTKPTRPFTTTTSPRVINKNLSEGSDGDDVVILQTTLEQGGFLVVPKGIKKGHFGAVTREALKKYQKAHGITPTGTFGPKTREAHNAEHEDNNSESGNNSEEQDTHEMKRPQDPPSTSMQGNSKKEDNDHKQGPSGMGGQSNSMQMPPQMSTPPAEAITACDDIDEGEACSFVAPGNTKISGTCKEIHENLACVPAH